MAEQAQAQTATKPATAVQAQPVKQSTTQEQVAKQSAENQTKPVEEISVWKKWWFWLIVVLIVVVLGAIAYFLI